VLAGFPFRVVAIVSHAFFRGGALTFDRTAMRLFVS